MKATRPRYGRRPDLEARRLLGVEAQDAGLLLRPPAAARRARLCGTDIATPSSRRRVDGVEVDAAIQDVYFHTGNRRALALLQGTAARPSRRRRALRRVGLVARHRFGNVRYLLCYWRVLWSAVRRSVSRRPSMQSPTRSDLVRLCTIAVLARGVAREPSRLLQTP